MLNRRQAIAASFGAAAAAVLPKPAKAVIVGRAKLHWIDANTVRVVLRNQRYDFSIMPAGLDACELPLEVK
jgi:hypothetical protein